MTSIIAIANQKGGVGKTTTSVNLGACLAVAERRTLLIDLDPQGNASSAVGLNRHDYENSNIYHAIIGQTSLENVIYQTEIPHLHVAPADNNLIGAEIELVSVFARESKLKTAIEELQEKFDYILIDCPPSLGILTVNALNAATQYIVPLQTEYFAMEGLSQLVKTVQLIKSSLNASIELLGILLTMFDSRNKLHKQVCNEMREHFGDKVFETFIPRNIKLSECPSFGRPIILYDVNSRGSKAYFEVAKEVIAKVEGSKVDNKNLIMGTKKEKQEGDLPQIPG